MTTSDYVRDLDVDVRYRVRFTIDAGQVCDFVVQLEVVHDAECEPVVRFDTAHGFAHCDRYAPDGVVEKHELLPVTNYNQALTWATQTIRVNWDELIQPFGYPSHE
jgi:hypothetical protein